MSQSGAVYQPTTVTYESSNSPQDRWSERPISYLAATMTDAARRPCGIMSCLPTRTLVPIVLLVVGIVSLLIGFIMLLNGSIGYTEGEPSELDYYMIVTIIGAIFFGVSVISLLLFFKMTRRLCFRHGKDHLDAGGGHSLVVNPSTDLLVAAQYAPISEVAYQPPQEDEQSKLMPQENKELSNEDTDRMVESDPRIVLRPLNPPTHEET